MKYNNTIIYKRGFITSTPPDMPLFFIVGRCLCGSRHYSEMMTYEEALSVMSKYIGVVDYFGGGIVELIDWQGQILKHKNV